MKNKVIHLSFTEHALGDYYFSLTNHRTCPRTMREVIPMDSCNPVPTWSTFLCDSCPRPVKCHQCMEFLTYIERGHVVHLYKVCVITSLKREISKKICIKFCMEAYSFPSCMVYTAKSSSTPENVYHLVSIALYMYP